MDSSLAPDTLLNKGCYRIIRKLGQGGFGITYLAEELGYITETGFDEMDFVPSAKKEKVVIKELFYEEFCDRNEKTGLITISSPQRKTEFEKLVNKQLEEGKILRRLSHPNIVRTRKIFRENDTAYMVMDHIEGTDLEKVLEQAGKLHRDKAVKYILQVLEALKQVHAMDILHLDIKPSNILIKKDTDDAMLIDFGASLVYDKDKKVKYTTSKLISGVSHYAPQEQHDIDNLRFFDATLDTYSVGGTLFHCVTGTLPPRASYLSSGRLSLPLPSSFNNELSDYFDEVIKKALNTKYNERFSGADEFLYALSNDAQYVKLMAKANICFGKKQYDDALLELERAESLLFATPSIIQLKERCNTAKGSGHPLPDKKAYQADADQTVLLDKRPPQKPEEPKQPVQPDPIPQPVVIQQHHETIEQPQPDKKEKPSVLRPVALIGLIVLLAVLIWLVASPGNSAGSSETTRDSAAVNDSMRAAMKAYEEAQPNIITGIVRDGSTGQPMSGVRVVYSYQYLDSATSGTYTNSYGYFRLDVSQFPVSLLFTGTGYKDLTVSNLEKLYGYEVNQNGQQISSYRGDTTVVTVNMISEYGYGVRDSVK